MRIKPKTLASPARFASTNEAAWKEIMAGPQIEEGADYAIQ